MKSHFINPLPKNLTMLDRRSFLATIAVLSVAPSLRALEERAAPKLKLGFDNFALRAFGWKAAELLDFAKASQCDALFISDLESVGSLEPAALLEVRKKADALGIPLYVGGWSICPGSKKFKDTWGTPEQMLITGIRVAKALGSPVFRVILGGIEDRDSSGGINARIAETVNILKSCRKQALAAGVKIAVENHAGDLHSWELVQLIQQAGPEFVGANFDSGNAAWALEDPLQAFENLKPYIVCSSLRDVMAWKTPEGASIAWTAAGEGLIDWTQLLSKWAESCPNVPVFVETISGFSRPFPYHHEGFWRHYPHVPPATFAGFEAMMKRGKEIPAFKAPEGDGKKQAEEAYQKAELERSLAFLRGKIAALE